jgi:hypothetical protein
MDLTPVSVVEIPGESSEDDIVDAIAALLDIVIVGTSATLCLMCRCVEDEHTLDCPVPTLEDWIASR